MGVREPVDRKDFSDTISRLLSDESLEWFPRASLTFPGDTVGDGQKVAVVDLDGQLFQLLENPYLEPAWQVADLASQLQDVLVEMAPSLRLESVWPACVAHQHTHPLTATVRDGRAVWECPATHETVRPI